MPNPRPKQTASRRQASSRWEAVWQGDGEAAAEIVAGGLSAAGIPTRTMGGQQLPSGYPHAFQRDTWAVFAPSARADDARDLLRTRGDEAGIVSGGDDLSTEQRATLRLLLILAIYVGLPAIVLGGIYTLFD